MLIINNTPPNIQVFFNKIATLATPYIESFIGISVQGETKKRKIVIKLNNLIFLEKDANFNKLN
ncbi:MAG: hypothetical protein BRC33_08280 [Cyanobacteria bacterium SW_9_44_58]|nr:MAG: hypothetical protein BRC33_08280 [Cyanobacteria bacterium SW_9_44_58]